MSTFWVCKHARLEDQTAAEVLSAIRYELATIIGADNILRTENRPPSKPNAELTVNAYEITAEGWEILTQGFAGPQGFERCVAP